MRQEAALVLWAAIALGLAFGVLPRGRPRRAVIIPALAAAALVLWILLGFAWSESDERTTAELARLLGYLGLVTLALTGLNRHTFRAAAAGLTAVAAGIAGLALASRLFPGSFPAATEVARVFRVDRLDYPLDYWNAVGAWGAMAVAACLAWSAHARLPRSALLSLAAVPGAGARST